MTVIVTTTPVALGPVRYKSVELTPVPQQLTGAFGEELTPESVIMDADTLRAKYLPDVDIEHIKAKYNVRPFIEAPPPQADSNETTGFGTIALDSLDLSQYQDGPEGLPARQKLASQLETSLKTYGFFNVVNTGFPDAKFDALRAIAQLTLELPEETKLQHLAGARQADLEDKSRSLGGERGAGFKPRGYWSMGQGVRDAVELYNVRDPLHDDYFFDPNRCCYPELVRAFLPEIAEYYRYVHFVVLRRLCSLCDLVLELPEGTLWARFFTVRRNDLVNSGAGYGRLMHYLGMDPEQENLSRKTWLRGHSDSCAFTFLTSQPILSLQIRDYYSGEWKYVGHRPNSLIVNIGDAMEFVTGGYFKSSVHRVVAPPPDQRAFRRLVLIYFNDPKLTAVIDPESIESPKLLRLGIGKPREWEKITFAHWADEKGRLFGRKDLNIGGSDEPVLVKLYGRYHERWHQVKKREEKKGKQVGKA